ncbi:hypothetical protein OUZ56_031893 [Daphnia magna]|uniref:Uncharacterized protein n=1 Tax=Daphnia magna TaxID=35525 RepID=A0ABQ9ZVK0_9CRUS|nr:hypothetical protein OUZ56_031893 [Daphnia magna]
MATDVWYYRESLVPYQPHDTEGWSFDSNQYLAIFMSDADTHDWLSSVVIFDRLKGKICVKHKTILMGQVTAAIINPFTLGCFHIWQDPMFNLLFLFVDLLKIAFTCACASGFFNSNPG